MNCSRSKSYIGQIKKEQKKLAKSQTENPSSLENITSIPTAMTVLPY